jgi:hypothetical protein
LQDRRERRISLRKSYIILELLQSYRARKLIFQAVKSPTVRRVVTRGVQRQLGRKLRGKR